jgi:hypothetical protein
MLKFLGKVGLVGLGLVVATDVAILVIAMNV